MKNVADLQRPYINTNMPYCLSFFVIIHGGFAVSPDLLKKFLFRGEFYLSTREMIEVYDYVFSVEISAEIEDIGLYVLGLCILYISIKNYVLYIR